MAEGAPLLRVYRIYLLSRVRIPLSPPLILSPLLRFFYCLQLDKIKFIGCQAPCFECKDNLEFSTLWRKSFRGKKHPLNVYFIAWPI